ncbi:YggT family protein [Pelagibacteraceae bacterium]|jgi:YggT family protein|nr:YggT family protein [Pelagibacterales bacterium SAG-MED32]MDC3085721.1 YggT family protein [Pelagibacteraceae bacterium]MDC3223087.1 YggT family protein [Pelagibacteraceae bacterium]
MNSLIILFDQVINLYTWVLIINVIFSWLIAMNIFNTQNRIIIAVYYGTKKLTDPLLNPIRNFLPNLSGIDISPVVLILILYFIRNLLFEYFYMTIAL